LAPAKCTARVTSQASLHGHVSLYTPLEPLHTNGQASTVHTSSFSRTGLRDRTCTVTSLYRNYGLPGAIQWRQRTILQVDCSNGGCTWSELPPMAALPCPVWSPCQVREPFSKAPAIWHHLEHHRRAQSDSQFSALDWDTHSRTENHSLASGLQPGHWNLSSPQACSLPWPTSRLGSENHSLEELAPTKGRDRLFSAQHVPPPLLD